MNWLIWNEIAQWAMLGFAFWRIGCLRQETVELVARMGKECKLLHERIDAAIGVPKAKP